MKLADVICYRHINWCRIDLFCPEAWSETGNQAGKSGASRVAEISRIFKSLKKIAMMLCFHWNLEILVGSELTRYWLGWTVPGKPQVGNISVHRLQLKGRRRRMRRRWRGAGQNRRDFRDSKLKDILETVLCCEVPRWRLLLRLLRISKLILERSEKCQDRTGR